MKNLVALFLLFSIAYSCSSPETKKVLRNGFEYEIYTSNPGPIPKPGDVVTLDLIVSNEKDIIIDDSRKDPIKPVFQIPEKGTPQTDRNPLMALIEQMRSGDSAAVYVPIDSLPSRPQSFEGSETIKYVLKVNSIEDVNAHKARISTEKAVKEKSELKIAKDAFDKYMKGELDGEKIDVDGTGVMVTFIRNTGRQVTEPGMGVAVDYFGFTKDGESFDNSVRAGRPFSFQPGTNSVIQGWDLGIPKIPEGSVAIIDVPYEYAYGKTGSPPNIEPYEDLIFYVTVVKVYTK